MTKLRCAILDDYQNVVLGLADWKVLADRVDVERFPRHFDSEKELIEAIKDCEIVVLMRKEHGRES